MTSWRISNGGVASEADVLRSADGPAHGFDPLQRGAKLGSGCVCRWFGEVFLVVGLSGHQVGASAAELGKQGFLPDHVGSKCIERGDHQSGCRTRVDDG
jgi:hypothetical protein